MALRAGPIICLFLPLGAPSLPHGFRVSFWETGIWPVANADPFRLRSGAIDLWQKCFSRWMARSAAPLLRAKPSVFQAASPPSWCGEARHPPRKVRRANFCQKSIPPAKPARNTGSPQACDGIPIAFVAFSLPPTGPGALYSHPSRIKIVAEPHCVDSSIYPLLPFRWDGGSFP